MLVLKAHTQDRWLQDLEVVQVACSLNLGEENDEQNIDNIILSYCINIIINNI